MEKQEIILEVGEAAYPKKICISLWGDKIITDLAIGSMLKVSFDIESREFNGKWYTNLKAWKVEVETVSEMEQKETVPFDEKEAYHEEEKILSPAFDDDLPF